MLLVSSLTPLPSSKLSTESLVKKYCCCWRSLPRVDDAYSIAYQLSFTRFLCNTRSSRPPYSPWSMAERTTSDADHMTLMGSNALIDSILETIEANKNRSTSNKLRFGDLGILRRHRLSLPRDESAEASCISLVRN